MEKKHLRGYKRGVRVDETVFGVFIVGNLRASAITVRKVRYKGLSRSCRFDLRLQQYCHALKVLATDELSASFDCVFSLGSERDRQDLILIGRIRIETS